MEQCKGFSLLEVLISLMLVTSLSLALLSQISQTKLLSTRLLLQSSALLLLDIKEERSLLNSSKA